MPEHRPPPFRHAEPLPTRPRHVPRTRAAAAGPVPEAPGAPAPPQAAPRRKRRRRFPPEVLTDQEVRALIRACSPIAATGLRNRALIALLYRSGLRVAEALALRPKDLDLAAGTVRVLRGKGGTFRTVGLDPGAGAMVARWMEARAAAGLNGVHPLICSLPGRPLTTGYVRRLLPRLARRAGIEKRVHAHGLRHTHAAQLRAEGVDIGIISRQLGHRSILTTIRYLDHVAPVAVVEAIRGREWLALSPMPGPGDSGTLRGRSA